MPQWVGERYTTGDPFEGITRGELRLPGRAYELTHPDIDHTMPGRSSMLGKDISDLVNYFTGGMSPKDRKQMDILETGTASHEAIQNWLQSENLLLKAEAFVYDKKNNISGHIDAIIRDGLGGKGKRALEIKTISQAGLEKLSGPKWQHRSQLNFYLSQSGIEKGQFFIC